MHGTTTQSTEGLATLTIVNPIHQVDNCSSILPILRLDEHVPKDATRTRLEVTFAAGAATALVVLLMQMLTSKQLQLKRRYHPTC